MAWLLVLLIPVVVGIIAFLPTLTIDTAAVVSSSAYAYVRAAFFFIPVNTISAILGIILGLWVFRIIIAIVRAIWDMLPV